MKTRGTYASNWPKGAVVHFTAGAMGPEEQLRAGAEAGHAYWCIGRDGKLFCAHSAEEWGYHAGGSRWCHLPKKLRGNVSDDLIGIEVVCAGKVEEIASGERWYRTWWNGLVPAKEVRYTPGVENQMPGHYHKFTPEQEGALTETILWLKAQHPAIFDLDLVLGHDEVSGLAGLGWWRKNDPGAALSMSLPAYREHLKKLWIRRS